MNSKKTLWLCLVIAAVAVAIFVAAILLTDNGTTDYNTAATQRARAAGQIGKNDILLLKSIDRTPGGDSKAAFAIYQLPEGADAADYLHLMASDCDLEQVGNASCTFIGDDPGTVYNLSAAYTK